MSSCVLVVAGFAAGALNAVAGGGSFLTLPALIFAGLPAAAANASSTVALFPGSFASALAYREDFKSLGGISAAALLPASVAGGLVGAALLVASRGSTFDRLLPWLFLLGAAAFALGPWAGSALRRYLQLGRVELMAVQFIVSVYGGYFGGAVGLMMMAFWTVYGATDLRAMNAAKALLVGSLNAVAVAWFAWSGIVYWRLALVTGAAAVAGGYVGARVGRKLRAAHLRAAITALNAALTVLLFARRG